MKLLRLKQVFIEIYDRPGLKLSYSKLDKLQQELIEIGSTCLEELPNYQCFSKDKKEFERLIIAVARNHDGKAMAFCSSYILDAGKLGEILHLGLTCIGPEARGKGLTHKLTSKVIYKYFTAHAKLGSFWISNVACVLSSLGNVALHFEDVYPSPFLSSPTREQQALAKLINRRFRKELYIDPNSKFDTEGFIFHGSVKDSVFQKNEQDTTFYHRDENLNTYFKNRINFQNGDEILQIGRVSLTSYPKYILRNRKKRNNPLLEKSSDLNVA